MRTSPWPEKPKGAIRIGVGGWTYEPWRGTFYPADLTQKRELEFAGRHLTSIEINGTFYGAQKPETFAKWRSLRHVVEVRHPSFHCSEFVALMRKHGVAAVIAGDSSYPQIADVTAPFVYARIMGTKEKEKSGYSEARNTCSMYMEKPLIFMDASRLICSFT